ncbi:APC family permease [Actinoplanes sp. TRM 88003]|uniref:APC family permease n=1 Tax=Paractinoplanes aksuensis TaxID=2939490 RepID=A0ABT1DRN1_9ACTN|nr:APC family permease [Actinoplanes aksuensis]MCO8273474.1 APC family permease [Actinoplanes aksuensis]
MGTPEESPHTLAPGRLGAAAVVFFALAVTAPIAVLITVVPAAYATGGGPLVPLSFLALGVVLLLFSAGYAAMAHRAPFSGAMFTYVARGLNRPAGVGAAWLAVACYQAIQLGLYGLVGAAAAPLLRSWFDVSVEWFVVAAGCWLLVALLGPIRAEIAGGLLALLVLAEVAVVAGFATANVLDPAEGGLVAGSVLPSTVDLPALGLLLAVGVLAFAGFETTGAYAEEAIRPRRDPGSATYVTVAALAILLAVTSWSLSAAVGPDRIAGLARSRGSELLFDLAGARLAPWAVTLGRLMLLTGLIAAILGLHLVVSRYLFALGRERVLPAGLGRTSRRTFAPRAASLAQTAVAALFLVAAATNVADAPTTGRRLMIAGGLGLLVLLIVTSVTALLHLNRVPNGEGAFTRFVAPVVSTVTLGAVAYLAFRDLALLFGVPGSSPMRWIVPTALAVVAALGVLHALILRGARPVIYAGIGQGGVPVVVTPAAPRPESKPDPIDPPPLPPAPKPSPAQEPGPVKEPSAAEEPSPPPLRAPGAHRPERVQR